MKKLTINQASELLGISPDLIRTWEKKKLIKSEKNHNNIRLFDIDLLQRVYDNCHGQSEEVGFKVLESSQKTELSVIELFAGCGGMALGLENAGLKTELLVEIDRDCVNTLQKNRPYWPILQEDVTKIDFRSYQGKIDIVSGGFPCQAFSYAGKGKGFEDTRGTLFFEFARCLAEVQPKIALAENVRGLLSHQQGKTLSIMLESLEELGYKPSYQVVSAQFLDVPQKRERVVIIAVRNDLAIPALFPTPKNYTISLREALQNCPDSIGVEYNERKKAIMELVPSGGNWRNLPLETQKKYMKNSFFKGGGRTGFAKRLSWDEPCLTITCSPAQTQTERCHPDETRPLTVREYARVQTFPDEWEFTGSLTSQYKQIGNAVPVNMSYHLGRGLIRMLQQGWDNYTQLDVRKTATEKVQQLVIPGLAI
ncbi:DNA-cytosine methyltransferase [Rippkaea orientalis PCC 8801]|uniref:Cytosine-specific methyltransferase n=1 Tax=Rippkaea orientalis (strain PCC 8801 / RF-1) TaxID=41431 RepID=B7K0N6_RIPO1|nr:DNA (cytosine-5-)-methyltransferase [Rippkaea orientalis]ACK64190.1 DNA-cytosine methyltransferase [Rippkaea orientalis PCC 8801]